jgi:hypothetical protein
MEKNLNSWHVHRVGFTLSYTERAAGLYACPDVYAEVVSSCYMFDNYYWDFLSNRRYYDYNIFDLF